jgi:hypothetical protein
MSGETSAATTSHPIRPPQISDMAALQAARSNNRFADRRIGQLAEHTAAL